MFGAALHLSAITPEPRGRKSYTRRSEASIKYLRRSLHLFSESVSLRTAKLADPARRAGAAALFLEKEVFWQLIQRTEGEHVVHQPPGPTWGQVGDCYSLQVT